MKIVHDFICVREINIVQTANSDWLAVQLRFGCMIFTTASLYIQNTEAVKNINASEMK